MRIGCVSCSALFVFVFDVVRVGCGALGVRGRGASGWRGAFVRAGVRCGAGACGCDGGIGGAGRRGSGRACGRLAGRVRCGRVGVPRIRAPTPWGRPGGWFFCGQLYLCAWFAWGQNWGQFGRLWGLFRRFCLAAAWVRGCVVVWLRVRACGCARVCLRCQPGSAIARAMVRRAMAGACAGLFARLAGGAGAGGRRRWPRGPQARGSGGARRRRGRENGCGARGLAIGERGRAWRAAAAVGARERQMQHIPGAVYTDGYARGQNTKRAGRRW